MDEHIARILKMLEEGKINAADAEKLLAALRPTPQSPPPPGGPPPPPGQRAGETRGEAKGESGASESSSAKSFEFSWSQKRSFPFDLSGLGKQISDAVRKIDPEKFVREARSGMAKGGKRWQDRMREWSKFMSGEEGQPENTLGLPVARATENLVFTVAPDASVQVENSYGAIYVLGGSEAVTIEIEKQAWATTEEEANTRLGELKVEALTQQTPTLGASRLEVRVSAPEVWRDGWANLRLNVPDGVSLKVETIFGEIRVENTAGQVDVHTISGTATLEDLRGEVRAEGISGDMRAARIGGPLRLVGKSGDLCAEHLADGGEVIGVSGMVRVRGVEGARIEAKSVSGDVVIEEAGKQKAIDVIAEAVSGDVSLNDTRGLVVKLKTISGDVRADGLEATTVQSETVSGDVRINFAAPFTGTLTTNTVSGDVTIRLPETSSFRYTLGTLSGELHCHLSAQQTGRTDTLHSGTVGGGDGTVTIHTRSGDVTIDKTE
jgi:DUF4097 and DUF4098 domain-containing protein YvlB